MKHVGAALRGRPPVHGNHSRTDIFDTIPGLCYRKNGEIAVKPPHYTDEEPPDPYGDEYFNALSGRIAYIETSRGCPFSCAFCLSGTGQPVRWFSTARAKNDILRLAAGGTRTVKFVDRTFNARGDRARELFRFIIGSIGKEIPAGVRFHFEIAGDLLDDDTLELLASAPKGVFQFEIGLQSFNEKTLAAVRRKTDTDRLKRNIRRLVSMGNIHIHIDLIAGLPYEDLDSFAGSFNTAYELGPHMLQLGFLKVLHGAAMREKPEAYPCRFSSAPPYQVLETPWLPASGLRTLRMAEEALGRLYNSGRFRRTLSYVLERTKTTPIQLFCGAGRLLEKTEGLSLDALTALMYRHFSSQPGVDENRLRDQMVRDRLATNASGRLPAVLKRGAGHIPEGRRRGAALLGDGEVLVTADYGRRDPVTGEYPLTERILPSRKDRRAGIL